jgi:hypothetical protein
MPAAARQGRKQIRDLSQQQKKGGALNAQAASTGEDEKGRIETVAWSKMKRGRSLAARNEKLVALHCARGANPSAANEEHWRKQITSAP